MKDSEIMRDFDEDKYLGKFCNKVKCHVCDGTDFNGEPNGYGCQGSDDYIKSRYDSILKRRLKKQRTTADINKTQLF